MGNRKSMAKERVVVREACPAKERKGGGEKRSGGRRKEQEERRRDVIW